MSIAYFPGPDTATPEALRPLIAAGFDRARNRVLSLADCDEEELAKQHSPLMSPLVWDLAHVGSQEEYWLLHDVGKMEPLRCDLRGLYDAFEYPRSVRPTLPLLPPGESRQYIAEVRAKALDILDRSRLEGHPLEDRGYLFGMMIQHEQQHAETMLATHQLRVGEPVLHAAETSPAHVAGDVEHLPREVLVPAGSFTMGTSLEPWAMDNERPAHDIALADYWIDTLPVTNAAFAEFIDDGGYRNRRWWTSEGWAHCVEADAFARWSGRRLPTEAEWEKAARWDPQSGRSRRYPWGDGDPEPKHANLGGSTLRPSPAGSYAEGASPLGVRQLMGDVWEWVSSDFRPYPGFTPFPYEEYSAVFFGPDYKVLRGGSWAADPVACRGTFRNWDYPIRRQIFSGFRTARDA